MADFIDMIEVIDGKCVGWDAKTPDVTYPVQLLDAEGEHTDDEEEAIGGIVSFADDRHMVFWYPGHEPVTQ